MLMKAMDEKECKRKNDTSHAFHPKAETDHFSAGLLARPLFRCLPILLLFRTVAGVRKSLYGLTATGIAPDFHWIPFSCLSATEKCALVL